MKKQEDSFFKEVLKLIRQNWNEYLEWIKPKQGDHWSLTIIKTFFKGLSAILFVALSPIVILILIIAFLAAF